MSTLRLTIELVPRTAWGRNVRAVVAGDTWDALRWYLGASRSRPPYLKIDFPLRQTASKLKCTYCRTEQETLDLHEVWGYDDNRKLQRLVALRPICARCHLTKHLGLANKMGRINEVLQHFAAVNGSTRRQARAACDRAFSTWERRSSIAYSLDVSHLERYIPYTKIHLNWLDKPRVWVGSRIDAIVWADSLLHSDAIIVDTETTGLLTKSNVEVIELAAINMKGKLLYHGLFKPRYKIPRRVIRIHGITNEEVKTSPSFSEQAPAITDALHGRTIITFNAKFDRDVIARTFTLHKLEGISARWECAMHAYRTFSGSGRYLPLPGKSHGALADCKATLRMIKRMARNSAP